jgi:hypothetical protein
VVSLGPSRLGSDDIATIVGTDSSAFAGADGATVGDFDLAGAFGNSLDATAIGANHLVDFLPSLERFPLCCKVIRWPSQLLFLHNDWVTDVDRVVVPLSVRGAQADAAVADILHPK